MAFVRSDAIRLDLGNVWYAGKWGYGWSRTASSDVNGYFLSFNTTGVDPSDAFYRYHGFPLRCLYPGSA